MLISIIRTVLLYAFIILAVRIMGKRQISDMQTSELVITLVISDIAAIPMQNNNQPLLSGLLPILVLVSQRERLRAASRSRNYRASWDTVIFP